MEKQIELLKQNLKTMNFGRLTPQHLESLKIKTSKTESHPLISLGSILAKSPRQLIISIYDIKVKKMKLNKDDSSSCQHVKGF
jgi:ribosome recycling factor